MKTTLEKHLLSKPSVKKDFQEDWEAHRYLIGGKMFAMHVQDNKGAEILTLKLNPEQGQEVRERYEGKVVPGYYMNKSHWNSIYLAEKLPDESIKKMIDESYRLVVSGLSKKVQFEIAQS
ncbi:MmcQ/YjbR family DNA-binding protein [Lactococcus hircilactis]|uniref:MmcQ/YjbR family DNA-binding protein n=1 Tax=Lactococcus hircilactis TaxID=1494462 RepID=A0A7X1Z9S8_9LACT|nr:MmcQ/YjbR family DNA-binding protein [Lactococcus hircilactis]MQW40469.1 MmcQ/YjbR family DNA-binding protein [Lactococcus hircilactis]